MEMQEMMEMMKELKEKQQEVYMEKLLDYVINLSEKANKKDYIATDKEREMFNKMFIIINDMKGWF